MTPRPEASRRARRFLGLLSLLGLIPVAGLSIGFSAPGSNELPRTIVNACLAMMRAAWQATEQHVAIHPLTTGIVLLLGGSLTWATLRILASVANTRRLLAQSETYAPGPHPILDAALAHRALSGLALRVLTSPRPLAFTVGLWHPQIVVSEGIVSSLSQAELRAVLFHERSHALRRDPLRLLVVRFLADALWFLPVARSLARDFVDAVEQGADDLTVAGTQEPLDLASALVKTAKTGMVSPVPLVSGFAGNLSVKDRVERLLGMPVQCRTGTTMFQWVSSALITLFLLVLLMPPLGGREAATERAMAEAMRRMPMMSCSLPMRQGH